MAEFFRVKCSAERLLPLCPEAEEEDADTLAALTLVRTRKYLSTRLPRFQSLQEKRIA
jgi:hypothetical protein